MIFSLYEVKVPEPSVPELVEGVEGPTYILQLSYFLKIIIFPCWCHHINLHVGDI